MGSDGIPVSRVLVPERVRRMRELAVQIHVEERIKTYILDIVFATRRPEEYRLDFGRLIRIGASPRASIGILCAARAHAFLKGRGYVIPDDVKGVAADVLRHRFLLSYEGEAEGVTSDEIIRRILQTIPAP
jgi:MoxR-like ATPase